MPYLPSRPFLICTICRISLCDFILKLCRVTYGTKVYGVPCRCEYSRLLWEISVVRVVQRVLDKVAHEHLDACRWFGVLLEIVRSDARVLHVVGIWGLIEKYLGVVVETAFWRLPSPGSGWRGTEKTSESMKWRRV